MGDRKKAWFLLNECDIEAYPGHCFFFLFFFGVGGESHIVVNQQKQALSFLVKEAGARVEYRQAGW